MAEHYWRANDALARDDDQGARLAFAELRVIQAEESNGNIRILLGAVERKIRSRSRSARPSAP